jgi:hypothetical protein
MVRVKPAHDAGKRSSWHFRRLLLLLLTQAFLLAISANAATSDSDDARLIGYTSDAIYSACKGSLCPHPRHEFYLMLTHNSPALVLPIGVYMDNPWNVCTLLPRRRDELSHRYEVRERVCACGTEK